MFMLLMGALWRFLKAPADGKGEGVLWGLFVATLAAGPIVPAITAAVAGTVLAGEGLVGAAKMLRRKRPPELPPPPRDYGPPPPPTKHMLLQQAKDRREELIAVARQAGFCEERLRDELEAIAEAYDHWVKQIIRGKDYQE